MATIKLQPSGNVLIKDGKVSCGCCGCGCYAISIPSNLRPLFENANISNLSAFNTLGDIPAAFFGYLKAEFSGGIKNDFWYADFSFNFPEVPPSEYLGFGFYYKKSTGCLTMGIAAPYYTQIEGYQGGSFDYIAGLVPEFIDGGGCSVLGHLGLPDGCFNPGFDPSPVIDSFTINGEGSFPFWYAIYGDQDQCSGTTFPTPNIVIT